MAITIRMTDSFRYTNAEVLASPHNYIIDIAQGGYPVPSPSNQINPADITSSTLKGGPALMKIRPDEDFILDEALFEALVNSGKHGGMSDFLNNLIALVANKTLEVLDDGSPLTTDQILNYGNP